MTMHRYFSLNTCYLKNYDLCMIHHPPDKVRRVDYMLAWGERLGSLYPDNLTDARIHMIKDYGMGLGGVVSNTCGCLIVAAPIKELIAKAFPNPDEVEFLRVAIYDQKNRLANDDYWFINPIGPLDCLDQQRSEIDRDEDGEVIGVDKQVLDLRRVDLNKPLFRPKEAPSSYLIRHDLLMAIKDLNLPVPNIYVEELEVTGAAE
jgi:hypothetical protein